MTLTLDSTSTKKMALIKELALQLGVKVIENPVKTVSTGPNKLMKDLEQSMKEVKKAKEGKLKLKTLDQLLDEK